MGGSAAKPAARDVAIGFSPGFPYMGYLPSELCGVPRLESPRLRVEPGSVALTGRQTGIYTETRPGGWNLIGRTPLQLVHGLVNELLAVEMFTGWQIAAPRAGGMFPRCGMCGGAAHRETRDGVTLRTPEGWR